MPKKFDDDDDDLPQKTGKPQAQRIPQHKHCMICHKAIPSKKDLCSDECEEKYQQIEKKRRTYMYIMYALFFFVIVMVMLSM